MPRQRLRLGRWVLLVLVVGLGLMHAGVGPASACSAMPGMDTSAGAAPATGPAAPGLHDRGGHHDAKGHGTGSHVGQMCLSTPAADHAPTAPHGVRRVAAATPWARPLPAVSSRAGRHPPPPDPVSFLCVDRQ